MFGLRIFGRDSINKIQEITDKSAVGIKDLRSPASGGLSLWEMYRPVWHSSRRRMYRTRGAYTGVTWPTYRHDDWDDAGERHYVAIKASIYKKAGRKFDLNRDLLRWMPGKERLYPSLAIEGHPLNVYQPGRRSLRVGTKLNYARRLGRGGSIPRRLGGGRHPARPLLEVGGTAALDLRRVVARYVVAHEDGLTAELDKATVLRTAGGRR